MRREERREVLRFAQNDGAVVGRARVEIVPRGYMVKSWQARLDGLSWPPPELAPVGHN